MSVYRNKKRYVDTIHEESEVITGHPVYKLSTDITEPEPTEEAVGRISAGTTHQSLSQLRAHFSEDVRVTGTWTGEVESETSEPNHGLQNISLTVTTDPIGFDTGDVKKVYISVSRENHRSCTIGKLNTFLTSIHTIRASLKRPQRIQTSRTEEIKIDKCFLHVKEQLTQNEIKAWNTRNQSESQGSDLLQIQEEVKSAGQTNILGEVDLTVMMEIYPPWGDPTATDLFVRPSRYGNMDDLDQIVDHVDHDWGSDDEMEPLEG